MKKIEITVGTKFDRNGLNILPVEEAAMTDLARLAILRRFDGFTELRGHGGWRPKNGEPVLEPSVTFVIFTNHSTCNPCACFVAAHIRDIFRQQAAALVISDVDACLI